MAAKRGGGAKMESTKVPGIYKRNGRYAVPIWNPAKGPNGRDWHTAETFEEAKDLKRREDEKRRKRGRHGGRETVRSFAKRWTSEPAWKRPAESTNLHNAERIRPFVRDFADRGLGDVPRDEVQLWAWGGIAPPGLIRTASAWEGVTTDAQGDVRVPDHRGAVPAVRAMYNDARGVQLVDANPFEGLRIPKTRGRRDMEDVLSERDLEVLLAVAEEKYGEVFGETMQALIATAAWTGLRPGELFALTADRVDFAAREIRVLEQLNTKTGKLEPTKNKQRRTVVMLPVAHEWLRKVVRPDGPAFSVQRGDGWRDYQPLFLTKRNQPYTGRRHHYYWDPVRTLFAERVGPEHWLRRRMEADPKGGDLDFYELRHRFGTALAEAGARPDQIADQMGHRDGGALALRVYIHPNRERLRDDLRSKFWDDEEAA